VKSFSKWNTDITSELLDVVVVARAVEHERHCISWQEIGNMFTARASPASVIEMLGRPPRAAEDGRGSVLLLESVRKGVEQGGDARNRRGASFAK
jgi:hypothetical protein